MFGELDLSRASNLEKYQFGLSYKHKIEEKKEKRLSRKQRDKDKNYKSYVVKQDIQWRYLDKLKSLGDYEFVENVVYLVVQYFTPDPVKIGHRNIKIQYYPKSDQIF